MLHILYYLDYYKNTCLFCPIGEIYAFIDMYRFFLYEASRMLFFYDSFQKFRPIPYQKNPLVHTTNQRITSTQIITAFLYQLKQ